MSVRTYFLFASGLGRSLRVPKGTHANIVEHVAEVEKKLGLVTTQYLDNPKHWDTFAFDKHRLTLDHKVYCETAYEHNKWVRWLYERMAQWQNEKLKGDTEVITPAMAEQFWHGLAFIDVPINFWTEGYYRDCMDHAYEVMRGRESEGETFEAKKKLTPEQASAVVLLFSQWIDVGDLRLCVPNGHDCLKSSSDGGYEWCSMCGAVDEDDFHERLRNCKKKKCDLRENHPDEIRD